MNLFSSLRRQSSLARKTFLELESFEARFTPSATTFVVPVSELADQVHTFHDLTSAIIGASNGGTVTVEPNSSTDLLQPIIITTNNVTIRGDSNIPATSLPSYQLTILANHVTLNNMNLRGINIGSSTGSNNSAFFNNTISNSLCGAVADFGKTTTLDQNTFTAGVKIINDNQNEAVDLVQNNVFSSTTGILLELDFGFGAQISGNQFFGDSTQTAIKLADCNGFPPGPTVVASNSILIQGDQFGTSVGIEVDQVGSGLLSFVQVNNNVISTQGQGTGIRMTMTQDGDFTANAFGNDFHNNKIGVSVTGDGTTGIGSVAHVDLNGGNDFRSFKAPASATSAAIVLQNAPTTTVLAQQNLFSVNPSTVVFASSGAIDTSNSLVNDSAFVQALYTRVLGRNASASELSFWSGQVAANGQAVVANGILRSSEALGPIVDQLYLQFLGRQSDTAGRNAWIGFLQKGGTREQVEAAFLTSPEYIAHISTDFVQSLYINIFGRTGAASELAFWNNQIQSLGLGGIANGFVLSTENRHNVIDGYFENLLHRIPTQAEIAPTISSSLDLLSIEAIILSSSEFYSNG
jgi:hypothetical protein